MWQVLGAVLFRIVVAAAALFGTWIGGGCQLLGAGRDLFCPTSVDSDKLDIIHNDLQNIQDGQTRLGSALLVLATAVEKSQRSGATKINVPRPAAPGGGAARFRLVNVPGPLGRPRTERSLVVRAQLGQLSLPAHKSAFAISDKNSLFGGPRIAYETACIPATSGYQVDPSTVKITDRQRGPNPDPKPVLAEDLLKLDKGGAAAQEVAKAYEGKSGCYTMQRQTPQGKEYCVVALAISGGGFGDASRGRAECEIDAQLRSTN